MQMLLKPFRSPVIQDQKSDGPPKCRQDQGKEANDHWQRLCSPGCLGTSFTASAFQVLGLLAYISIRGKHIPYTKKKMRGMLDVIFFFLPTLLLHIFRIRITC